MCNKNTAAEPDSSQRGHMRLKPCASVRFLLRRAAFGGNQEGSSSNAAVEPSFTSSARATILHPRSRIASWFSASNPDGGSSTAFWIVEMLASTASNPWNSKSKPVFSHLPCAVMVHLICKPHAGTTMIPTGGVGLCLRLESSDSGPKNNSCEAHRIEQGPAVHQYVARMTLCTRLLLSSE